MDIKTIMVCNAVLPLFLGVALLFFRSWQKTYASFGLWIAGTFAIGLGYIGILLWRSPPNT